MKKFFFILAMVLCVFYSNETFAANLVGRAEVSEPKIQEEFVAKDEVDFTGYDLYQHMVKCLKGSPLHFELIYDEDRFPSQIWMELEAEIKNGGILKIEKGEDVQGKNLIFISNN